MATKLGMLETYLDGPLSDSHMRVSDVVVLDRVNILSLCISTFTRRMITKLS